MEPDRIHPWRMGCTEESASPLTRCLFQRHIFLLLPLRIGNRSDNICMFHDPLKGTNKSDKIESAINKLFSYQIISFFNSDYSDKEVSVFTSFLCDVTSTDAKKNVLYPSNHRSYCSLLQLLQCQTLLLSRLYAAGNSLESTGLHDV